MFIEKARVRLINHNQFTEIILWCTQFIGEENTNWYWTYVNDSVFDSMIDFVFSKEEYANLFALRWL